MCLQFPQRRGWENIPAIRKSLLRHRSHEPLNEGTGKISQPFQSRGNPRDLLHPSTKGLGKYPSHKGGVNSGKARRNPQRRDWENIPAILLTARHVPSFLPLNEGTGKISQPFVHPLAMVMVEVPQRRDWENIPAISTS